MRRAALTLLLASLLTIPALADGELTPKRRAHNGLPPPQPGVVVTMERGVRVWRPVTAASDAIGAAEAYPQSTATGGYDPAYGGKGGFGYGWGYPYGYGYGYGMWRHHERRYPDGPGLARREFDHDRFRRDVGHGYEHGYEHMDEHSHGVTIIRPQFPRYAMGPAMPYSAAPIQGAARPPLRIHVNVAPMMHGAGHSPGPILAAPAHAGLGRAMGHHGGGHGHR